MLKKAFQKYIICVKGMNEHNCTCCGAYYTTDEHEKWQQCYVEGVAFDGLCKFCDEKNKRWYSKNSKCHNDKIT